LQSGAGAVVPAPDFSRRVECMEPVVFVIPWAVVVVIFLLALAITVVLVVLAIWLRMRRRAEAVQKTSPVTPKDDRWAPVQRVPVIEHVPAVENEPIVESEPTVENEPDAQNEPDTQHVSACCCPQCGVEMQPTYRFCVACGARLGE